MRRTLRTLHSGVLEYQMDDQQRRAADDWIGEHYLFLQHPDQRPSLEWFLDTAEVAVVRHGARIVQIDPWNRLEAARGKDESETDYIGRCLRTLHGFANDLNCHVQIVAHPSKMGQERRTQPPLLEDISGSKNWDNMPDQGFAVHRPKVFDAGSEADRRGAVLPQGPVRGAWVSMQALTQLRSCEGTLRIDRLRSWLWRSARMRALPDDAMGAR